MKDEPMTAVIKIAKSSSVPQCTDGNRLYSLEGAEYSVYQNEACTQYVDKIVTDESGEASLEGLALGKYWVKETKAPAGVHDRSESLSGRCEYWKRICCRIYS